MKTFVTPEIKDIMEAVHYRPAVSIIMPFEPKMGKKSELAHALDMAADRVERDLSEHYPDELAMLVMRKMRKIIKDINYNTYKKSIAIYVSPVFEKILYLDITVDEKIIIDESFEIRDLVYSKKQLHKYLVLLLSSTESRIYLGNSTTFITIVSSKAAAVNSPGHELPERVANFSDKAEQKEIMLHKFLHHIDNTLDIILKAYRLPVFVLGTQRIAGHFRQLTKHAGSVIEFVHGNYEEATQAELKTVLEPFINDWKKVMQIDLMNQLDEAAGKKKLSIGMKDVWREAMKRNGRLLLVEKNYMYAAEYGSSDEVINKAMEPYNRFSYIKDAVDDVIEKVLENGGDVEFVDEGVLKDHQQIALVKYF
jgi:hypothetical protein